jgi:hypothetical protein
VAELDGQVQRLVRPDQLALILMHGILRYVLGIVLGTKGRKLIYFQCL